MQFFQTCYGHRIYNLDYGKLTTDQNAESKNLIEHLGLKWKSVFLFPQKNKRAVRTASQQQVRQNIYQGSSQQWRKYEPFPNGTFDDLAAF